ncbi:MAG: hypothetical protein OEV73_13185 [Desulfobulbaceae bacterium]|nr:hypothetical protein [Desulfobulbaceae bacterium]
MSTEKIKYDLAQMLAEIKDDEKVFEHKPDLWASQADINRLVRERKKNQDREQKP